jgi:succinyl-CoA synthetase beta subunit
MKLHEYQAKELLARQGVAVPPGKAAHTVADAVAAAKQMGGTFFVVKAQVHAGGRGKAGFVELVRSPEAATEKARFMLTNRMVSNQTGAEGLEVTKLLVAAGVDIAHEYYLAITTDRKTRRNVLIASAEGGVDIEEVAHTRPEAIIREPLHPILGLQAHQARSVAFKLGFKGKQVGQAVKIMTALAKLYIDKDCTLAEINPLITTPATEGAPDGQVLAIDAKFNFDDNATFRHKDIQQLFDPAAENPAEMRASRMGLTYIALDGNIGCLVNGAGLAMATMDIIKHHGGDPANFLDVGGGASKNQVAAAFKIILGDSNVKGIFINIFGGIMDCNIVAEGVVAAARETHLSLPLVVRLEGNNVEAGKATLAASGLDIVAADDMDDGAKKIVAAVQ